MDPQLVIKNTKEDSPIMAAIGKIFIFIRLVLNKLSYHPQHISIKIKPTQGPNENIKYFIKLNLIDSLDKSLAASDIGCKSPLIITLLGPLR